MPKELNVSVSDDVYGALHREFSRIKGPHVGHWAVRYVPPRVGQSRRRGGVGTCQGHTVLPAWNAFGVYWCRILPTELSSPRCGLIIL